MTEEDPSDDHDKHPVEERRDHLQSRERRADPVGTPDPAESSRAADQPAKVHKLNKRQKKTLRDNSRPLDSWERYRALTDVVDEQLELVDLADHKARFALIIMGALNAFLFIIASDTDVFDSIPQELRPIAGAFVGLYAVMAVYFFVQAIESLRPRKAQPDIGGPTPANGPDQPVGLRFYEDVLSREVMAYRQVWRDVTMGQLNSELAVQVHALAAINKPKYAALNRLYLGLKIMTVCAATFLVIGALFVLMSKANRGKVRLDRTRSMSAFLLGIPTRGKDDGGPLGKGESLKINLREPSGLVFHPKLGNAFVVGDAGTMLEIDAAGRDVQRDQVRGDLEEVTVYTPTGELVILDEKKGQLIFWNAASNSETRRWTIDQAAVLGEAPGKQGNGFEGLSFKEDRQKPGGGTFFLAHQRDPIMIVGLSFDPAGRTGKIDGSAVASRWPMAGFEEINAVSWVPAIDRLLALDDKRDMITVLRSDGTVEGEVPVPGEQQEGLTVDAAGNIWIADDQHGLLQFREGLKLLQEHLRGGSQAAEPPKS